MNHGTYPVGTGMFSLGSYQGSLTLRDPFLFLFLFLFHFHFHFHFLFRVCSLRRSRSRPTRLGCTGVGGVTPPRRTITS